MTGKFIQLAQLDTFKEYMTSTFLAVTLPAILGQIQLDSVTGELYYEYETEDNG
jgi:hypothetical protein